MIGSTTVPSRGSRLRVRRSGWQHRAIIAVLAVLVIVPLSLVIITLFSPTREIWAHLRATILSDMIRNTVIVVGGVAATTLILGTALAWLVTAYDFPGKRFFDKALVLPLAIPGYIFAFVFIATFDYIGIVQTTGRRLFGQEFSFPNIYNRVSAILVLTLTLYPYVYLLARAAFRGQSGYYIDAARTMGYSRIRVFFRLVIPLARPALIGGVSLAAMEALGDFATVRFFNVPTLSEGVFRIWEGMMNRDAAMEVAGLLALVAIAIVLIEIAARKRARYTQLGGRSPGITPEELHGRRAVVAVGACVTVLLLGFVLPTLQLTLWAIQEVANQGPGGTLNVAFRRYMSTTAGFALLAAAATVLWSLLLAHSVRVSRSGPLMKVTTRVATMGYAMPGAVVGIGVLLAVTSFDRGLGLGRFLTGSIVALVYAYVVRFLAVGHNSVDAAIAAVRPSFGEAARTLGAAPFRVLRTIHAPLMSRGIFAAAVFVFVDVMKELPITMLLRPFGMDTLAIWGYLLATEGFWEAAAVPALSILGVGLVPVLMLTGLSGK